MEAAAAKMKITPSLDTCGFKGIHDDLYVRSVLIKNNETILCVISFDLIGIDKATVDKICSLLKRELNIPPSNVLITCTHNHGAFITPPIVDLIKGKKAFCEASRAYINNLIKPLVETILTMEKNLVSASFCAGSEKFSNMFVENSRPLLRDKTIGWSGFTKDEIITPTGPVDPEVGVLHIKDQKNMTIATIYNYSCHACTGAISGKEKLLWTDYPGIASKYIEETIGGTALFTAGASGDIHPVGIWYNKDFAKRYELALKMGNDLGVIVEKTIQQMSNYHSDIFLKGIKKNISIPMRKPESWIKPDMAKVLSRNGIADGFKEELFARYDFCAKQLKKKKGQKVKSLLQILLIDNCVLVAVPGEPFVEYGIEIKKGSPYPFTFVVVLANDAIGYMPTETGLKLRGYQTWPLWYSKYPDISSGRQVVEMCLELTQNMYDENCISFCSKAKGN